MVWFFFLCNRTRTHLNADVRWTSACRRLDGGNTIIFFRFSERKCKSSPVVSTKKPHHMVWFFFLCNRTRTHLNADVRRADAFYSSSSFLIIKKADTRVGIYFFGGSSGTRLHFLPLGENKGADAIELASGNTPRGVAFDCSSPFLVIKKSDTH